MSGEHQNDEIKHQNGGKKTISSLRKPLISSNDEDPSTTPSKAEGFQTSLKYYQKKLPEAPGEAIKLGAMEWDRYQHRNSLRRNWREFILRKDSPPEDIIMSWLLLRSPGYLEELAASDGRLDVLFALPRTGKEQKESKAIDDTPITAETPLGLYDIFIEIQTGLRAELDGVHSRLVTHLMDERYGCRKEGVTAEDIAKAIGKYIKGKGATTEEMKKKLWFNLKTVPLEEAKERYALEELEPYINTRALFYIKEAKELYAQRVADIDADLKVLKKAINSYARKNNKPGRLTKRGGRGIKKKESYFVMEDDEDHLDNEEDLKEEERQKKTRLRWWSKWIGYIYPLLRSGAAVYGTCLVFAKLLYISAPFSMGEIATLAGIGAVIFVATYHSNFELALNSINAIKKGLRSLFFETEEEDGKLFRRSLKSGFIILITLGVIAVYSLPLFSSIVQFGGSIGLSSTAYLPIAGVASLLMAGFITEIYLPQISKFVREFFKNLAGLGDFLDTELFAPVRTGRTRSEKLKLALNHSFPNLLRIGAFSGCVLISSYVVYSGLKNSITGSAGLIPGWNGSLTVSNIAITLVTLSFVAAFIFVYKKMYGATKVISLENVAYASKKIAAFTTYPFRWVYGKTCGRTCDSPKAFHLSDLHSVFNSKVEDLTRELHYVGRFGANQSQFQSQEDAGELRLGPNLGARPVEVDGIMVTVGSKTDSSVRAIAALGSVLGTIGVGLTEGAKIFRLLIEGLTGTLISIFNKFGGSAKVGLDRGSDDSAKPHATYLTYNTYAPLTPSNSSPPIREEQKNGIDVSTTHESDGSSSPSRSHVGFWPCATGSGVSDSSSVSSPEVNPQANHNRNNPTPILGRISTENE